MRLAFWPYLSARHPATVFVKKPSTWLRGAHYAPAAARPSRTTASLTPTRRSKIAKGQLPSNNDHEPSAASRRFRPFGRRPASSGNRPPLRPLPEAGLGASRGSRAAIHSVYLLTSSARRSTDCGIVMLRALTAFNMMTSSNFVGCCIGSSRKAQGQGVPRLARRGSQPQSQTETGRRPLISEARCGDRHTLNGICPVKS